MTERQTRARDALPPAGVVLLLIVAAGWGLNWVSIKVAVSEVSPWTFRAFGVIVGAGGMLAAVRLRMGRLTFPRQALKPLLVLSLLNVTVYQICVAFGLGMIEATRGIIVGHTHPLWTAMLAAILLREAFTRVHMLALALGLAAMVLVVAPEAGLFGGALWGAVLITVASILWSFGLVLFKRFDIPLTALELGAWQLFLGGIPIVVYAAFLDPAADFAALTTRGWIAMLYSAFIATLLVNWAWYRALQILPAFAASLGTLMIPIVGLFAGAAILDERLTWIELTALALVLISVGLVAAGPTRLAALWRCR